MAHINLPQAFPGIRSLFMFRPETAEPLDALVQTLLHNPHPTLSAGERELIAAYVSRQCKCKYCCNIHGVIAKPRLGNDAEIVKQVLANPETAPISSKLKALLKIACKVQNEGKNVTQEDIEITRNVGATDVEIYDTVLIAAAFCMYNCYVHGLAAGQLDNEELYDELGEQGSWEGYQIAPFKVNMN